MPTPPPKTSPIEETRRGAPKGFHYGRKGDLLRNKGRRKRKAINEGVKNLPSGPPR